MKIADTNTGGSPTESNPPWKSRRRVIDAVGLALFHVAIFGVLGWASRSFAPAMPWFAAGTLAMDAIFFFSPPKRKPLLDPETEPDHAEKEESATSFAFEFLVLLVPPALLIALFLSAIWQHRTLGRNELIGVVAGMPVVVGLVSRIIYLRLTRAHVGVRNNATQFIALSMVATWVVSTILFCVLAVSLVYRWKSF